MQLRLSNIHLFSFNFNSMENKNQHTQENMGNQNKSQDRMHPNQPRHNETNNAWNEHKNAPSGHTATEHNDKGEHCDKQTPHKDNGGCCGSEKR